MKRAPMGRYPIVRFEVVEDADGFAIVDLLLGKVVDERKLPGPAHRRAMRLEEACRNSTSESARKEKSPGEE